MKIKTIGHSNKTVEELISKLQENEISILVDVRSAPYSKWCPHFNKPTLSKDIESAGIFYVWAGNELGGLRKGDVDWDSDVEYLIHLYKKIKKGYICVMCSEGDPLKCHRHQNIKPALERGGVEVEHILWVKPKRVPVTSMLF